MVYPTLKPPLVHDECIMEKLMRQGVKKKLLTNLNQICKHQEVLSLSEIATTKGYKIDPICTSLAGTSLIKDHLASGDHGSYMEQNDRQK